MVTVVELNDAQTLDGIPNEDPILEDAAANDHPDRHLGRWRRDAVAHGDGHVGHPRSHPRSDRHLYEPGRDRFAVYTPVANQHGTAIITVKVKDSGGTEFGGVNEVMRTSS